VTPDFAELFAFCDLHTSRWRGHPVLRGFVTGPQYYDRHGFPIPGTDDDPMTACLEWARRREAATYEEVCVGRDEFPDGSYLSTVWIGLNHAFIGPPLIFETMYFSSEIEAFELPTGGTQYARPSLEFPDPHDGELTDTLRYTTEEEAAATHREIARRLRKRWEV